MREIELGPFCSAMMIRNAAVKGNSIGHLQWSGRTLPHVSRNAAIQQEDWMAEAVIMS